MTVDALVNLFIQHDKTIDSPLSNLQTELESQREQHFTASSPHPLPNVSVRLHQSPTTALVEDTDAIDQPVRRLETEFQGVEAPVVDRCVDLDILSPPPPSPLLPVVDADCAFCGTAGTPHTCGALVAVRLGDQKAAVHHACALWAPQVYQPQVSYGERILLFFRRKAGSSFLTYFLVCSFLQDCDAYLNLESEWRHSQSRRCLVCHSYGAAVTCTHAGCRAAYHLPCAAVARNVTLDKSSFELWCPKHVQMHDNNSEEEDYGTERGASRQYNRASGTAMGEFDEDFSPARPRRNAALNRKHRYQRAVDGAPGGGADSSSGVSAARDRATVVAATAAAAVAVSDRTQRPRTDWQRQGDAWVKVVPPWWCEHRTIHFASK
jgi:PHD-like zinc-binding domain